MFSESINAREGWINCPFSIPLGIQYWRKRRKTIAFWYDEIRLYNLNHKPAPPEEWTTRNTYTVFCGMVECSGWPEKLDTCSVPCEGNRFFCKLMSALDYILYSFLSVRVGFPLCFLPYLQRSPGQQPVSSWVSFNSMSACLYLLIT